MKAPKVPSEGSEVPSKGPSEGSEGSEVEVPCQVSKEFQVKVQGSE